MRRDGTPAPVGWFLGQLAIGLSRLLGEFLTAFIGAVVLLVALRAIHRM